MPETYASTPVIDDIMDDESETTRLDRATTDYIARNEGRSFARTTSLRQAVRDDLGAGREWASTRTERAREAITEEPLKATIYALGLGVLIGMLLRR